jgi:acyl carrier protein
MSITVTHIFADLRELQEQLDIDLDGVPHSGAVSLEDDLGMDSLSMMDFLVFLEKKYGVSIPDEKLHDVATVADVVQVVAEVSLAGARA